MIDKIRHRFPWLELIWADSGYNAHQVDAAIAKVEEAVKANDKALIDEVLKAYPEKMAKRRAKHHAQPFIETDLVDPRYFSAANVKNRLESYFQMVKQKRAATAAE